MKIPEFKSQVASTLKMPRIHDETFRDGMQDPRVKLLSPDEAIDIFHSMVAIGTESASAGFPGASDRHRALAKALAQTNQELGSPVELGCLSRLKESDVNSVKEVIDSSSYPFRMLFFIAADTQRILAEKWDKNEILKAIEKHTKEASSNGLKASLAIENCIQGIHEDPEFIAKIFLTHLNNGGDRVCIADTTGRFNHLEVGEAVKWTRNLLNINGFKNVGIDFHGHNDLQSAVANSLEAIKNGADQIDVTGLGIGERCGNTDRLTFELHLAKLGLNPHNIKSLVPYTEKLSKASGREIPNQYPGLGEDSRAITSGTHAAAIYKASQKQDPDSLYIALNYEKLLNIRPRYIVQLGPQSGKGNLLLFAQVNELNPENYDLDKILETAKRANQPLSQEEAFNLFKKYKMV